MTISLILLAGGLSIRMKGETPKTFLEVKKKPLIQYSLDIFNSLSCFKEKVVVCKEKYTHYFSKEILIANPGKRRQDSLKNGLLALRSDVDLIMIHDGARPLLKKNDLLKLIEFGKDKPGSALAMPVKNSLKKVSSNNKIRESISRENLWEVYTPQLIQKDLLLKGFAFAEKHNLTVTDDLSLIEVLGYTPLLVPSSYPNIKLTDPSDLFLLEALL
ncbi:MAG: 2-C-methyl-D-erythritol 4-phosphate cytidylyltransferase [Chlamydiae bacterium]|nr:2-C-methyl-D-erythritol 4-phosphate cytidylyltransferase [Chlamydiota bacterium]